MNADQNGPGRPAFKGGFCSNLRCLCARPELPCEEYMPYHDDDGWCPRCGWNEAAHGWAYAPPETADSNTSSTSNDRRSA